MLCVCMMRPILLPYETALVPLQRELIASCIPFYTYCCVLIHFTHIWNGGSKSACICLCTHRCVRMCHPLKHWDTTWWILCPRIYIYIYTNVIPAIHVFTSVSCPSTASVCSFFFDHLYIYMSVQFLSTPPQQIERIAKGMP